MEPLPVLKEPLPVVRENTEVLLWMHCLSLLWEFSFVELWGFWFFLNCGGMKDLANIGRIDLNHIFN